jgi:hypothetical protein
MEETKEDPQRDAVVSEEEKVTCPDSDNGDEHLFTPPIIDEHQAYRLVTGKEIRISCICGKFQVVVNGIGSSEPHYERRISFP